MHLPPSLRDTKVLSVCENGGKLLGYILSFWRKRGSYIDRDLLREKRISSLWTNILPIGVYSKWTLGTNRETKQLPIS